MKLAERIARLDSETAFEVLVKARALEAHGKSVVHLEIGQPDFRTPRHIVEAGQRALDEGYTRYGPTPGDPELRAAIANHMRETRNIDVDAANVCVVPGGKPVMFYAILALVDPGDEVIYPNPGFPIYESMIKFAEGVPVPIPLVEDRQFSFDLDVFRAKLTNRTKLVILNSPQNPTGGVIPESDLREIASLLRGRNTLVLSDEIYSRMYYGAPPVSIASLDGMLDRTVILDGFSKIYAMTGWRLGYAVAPQPVIAAMDRLMVNSNSCTASFTQRAGLAALTGPQDEPLAMVAEFRRRRDTFVAALNTLPGFRCPTPEGAFYAFPNITGTGYSSRELADRLLNEAGVACLSGTSFGAYGEGYLRFSYAASLELLNEAVDRMRRFLA
ncbi:MAG: pyridoxal phosphate-dependent aminotransferase [Bryobacteraceae bacterium]|nr:pyridoxal phosphate-dependent aminotransferase [Bryobacteraceae bacterium]